ncbi:MAG: HutD family protein [Alphaproteobacteria bacterium]|nr:HutD family protein [Alphaproteobacteria bacterium]
MIRLRPSDYRDMPWKNGGGMTRELWREDAADPARPFLWRVSMADVASDGPFSAFAGFDRHIMTVKGEGMTLHGSPMGPIEVYPAFVPRRFSGDWPITARLRQGAITDFNLIVDRALTTSAMDCLAPDGPSRWAVPKGEVWFLHLASGRLGGGATAFNAGESLLLREGEVIDLPAPSGAAQLIRCRIGLAGALAPT